MYLVILQNTSMYVYETACTSGHSFVLRYTYLLLGERFKNYHTDRRVCVKDSRIITQIGESV